jgi:hypothetical protein
MIKPFFIFVALFPIFSFSQDTTFNKKLSEITIKSAAKKETNLAVINMVRNNSAISDGVSIEFIKKTPDRTVGDALKRISGVTIQNDKFVLVRGLSDRYNLAMLNKTMLPSTEPDRRTFSFDIIPTTLIDNILINKSAAANLPGDFSGGLVQVSTKEVSNNFLNVSIGSGWGSVSTLRDFKLVQRTDFPSVFPSTYKYRIGTNGDKIAYTKLIGAPEYKSFTSIPNMNSSLSFGIKKDRWNVLFSSVARNTFSLNYIDRLDYQSSTELAYKYKDTTYTNIQSLNGLLNIVYFGKYRYNWKTLFNHQEERSYMTRNGENYDNVQYVLSNSSNNVIKKVLNSQFNTKIKTIDFNFGYNLMLRDQPDYRVNPITKSLYTEDRYTTAWRDTYRFWSVLNENSFNGGINKDFGQIKIGAGYIKRIRDFKARIFRYTSSDMLDEITNNSDRYKANFDLISSYAMYDKELGDWKINAGLRTEYNKFNVNTADFSGQRVSVNRNYLDFLPSINISKTAGKIKKRVSISKTLARPEFREVANFAYYDFVRNAQLLGNSKLEKSDIYNVDLKWEYYPNSGENISVSAFGKQFIKPIEQIVADGSVPSNLLLTYTNPDKAFLYGIELEVRKKLLDWLDFYANASIMTSEVNANGIKRPLQGQSNYMVNSGINVKKNNNTLSLVYNRVGDRISAVGFQGYSNIFENSRDIIDITFLRKFKKVDIKLSVSDLLSQPSIYYQKPQRNLIKTNNEKTISLTVNVNL